MKGLKKIFGNYLLLSAICIILGAALIASPESLVKVISYTIGGISLAVAALEIARFLLSKNSSDEDSDSPGVFLLVRGLVLAAIGIFLIVKPDFLAQVFSFAFGLYMLVSGGVSLYESLRIKKQVNDGWQMTCALSLITVIGGIVIIVTPMLLTDIMITMLGILLVVTGVSNLIGTVVGKSKIEGLLKDQESSSKRKKKDREFIDID